LGPGVLKKGENKKIRKKEMLVEADLMAWAQVCKKQLKQKLEKKEMLIEADLMAYAQVCVNVCECV
jgi:hypothetical protein